MNAIASFPRKLFKFRINVPGAGLVVSSRENGRYTMEMHEPSWREGYRSGWTGVPRLALDPVERMCQCGWSFASGRVEGLADREAGRPRDCYRHLVEGLAR